MIRVELKPFREAVNRAVAAVKPKSPKPILQFLHLSAAAGKLTVRGCDLEVWIAASCPCETPQPESAAVLGVKLREILAEMKGDELTIDVGGTHVTLATERDRHKLQGASVADFPALPHVAGHPWEIAARGLKAALRVRFAADDESVRYAMNAVAFIVGDGQRVAVSTDGRRLACLPLGDCPGDERRVLLPDSSARLLSSLLPEEGIASIEDNGNQLAVTVGDLQFVSSLIEGRFPDYKKVRPADCRVEVTLAVEALRSVSRSAAIATNEESRGVTYTLAAGMLTASATAAGIGESEATAPIAYDGPATSVILDPRFILEFLRECMASSVRMRVIDADSAVVFETDEGFWMVQMPLTKS